MQARSSETGEMVTWTAEEPDWSGTGFPGPGSPEFIAVSSRPSGGGGGTNLPVELVLFAGNAVVTSDEWTRIGGRSIDFGPYPAELGGLARHIFLEFDIARSPGATSAEIQVVDVTRGEQIKYAASESLATERSVSSELGVDIEYPGFILTRPIAQYEVQVRRVGGTSNDAALCVGARLVIRYGDPLPVIESIAPSTGYQGGGTTVVLTGRHFDVAGIQVTFDGAPAASVVVDSDEQITAVTPSHPGPGLIDVVVKTPAGESRIYFTFTTA